VTVILDSGSGDLAVASSSCDSSCKGIPNLWSTKQSGDEGYKAELTYGSAQVIGEVFEDAVVLGGEPSVNLNLLAITSQVSSIYGQHSFFNGNSMRCALDIAGCLKNVRRSCAGCCPPAMPSAEAVLFSMQDNLLNNVPCIADADYSFDETGILGFGPDTSSQGNNQTVRAGRLGVGSGSGRAAGRQSAGWDVLRACVLASLWHLAVIL